MPGPMPPKDYQFLEVDRDILRLIDALRLPREVGAAKESRLAVLRRVLQRPQSDYATVLQLHMKSEEFDGTRDATKRYLSILGCLYEYEPKRFVERTLEIRKRSRSFIGRSRKAIEQGKDVACAQQIPGSNLWALTNLRTDQKAAMLGEVMAALGFNTQVRKWAMRVYRWDLPERLRRSRKALASTG